MPLVPLDVAVVLVLRHWSGVTEGCGVNPPCPLKGAHGCHLRRSLCQEGAVPPPLAFGDAEGLCCALSALVHSTSADLLLCCQQPGRTGTVNGWD